MAALFHADGRYALTTLIDINSELDELDREEFYRLKKVCTKQWSFVQQNVLTVHRWPTKNSETTLPQMPS